MTFFRNYIPTDISCYRSIDLASLSPAVDPLLARFSPASRPLLTKMIIVIFLHSVRRCFLRTPSYDCLEIVFIVCREPGTHNIQKHTFWFWPKFDLRLGARAVCVTCNFCPATAREREQHAWYHSVVCLGISQHPTHYFLIERAIKPRVEFC
jgi:hypothetical protein